MSTLISELKRRNVFRMIFLNRFIEYKTLLETELDWPFYDKLKAQPEFEQTIKEINKHKTAEANQVLA